jgi:hypothetical protein
VYVDSPLMSAVTKGRVLVVDEAVGIVCCSVLLVLLLVLVYLSSKVEYVDSPLVRTVTKKRVLVSSMKPCVVL